MKKHFHRAIAASTTLALSGVASAGIVFIDFEDAEDGVSLTDQYEGLTFGLVGAPDGPKAHKITKKKLLDKYGDAGGITIRPSNSDKGTFKGPWFDIEIGFDTPTDYFSILALDADEPISAFAYMGDVLVDVIGFKGGSNFQVREVVLGELGGAVFDRVVLDIRNKGGGMKPGPEIFDNLRFNDLGSVETPPLDPSPDPLPPLPDPPTTDGPRGTPETPTPGALGVLALGGLFSARRRRECAA